MTDPTLQLGPCPVCGHLNAEKCSRSEQLNSTYYQDVEWIECQCCGLRTQALSQEDILDDIERHRKLVLKWNTRPRFRGLGIATHTILRIQAQLALVLEAKNKKTLTREQKDAYDEVWQLVSDLQQKIENYKPIPMELPISQIP